MLCSPLRPNPLLAVLVDIAPQEDPERFTTQNRMGSFPLRKKKNNPPSWQPFPTRPFFLSQKLSDFLSPSEVWTFQWFKFLAILGAPWRWLQEANVKLKSCLSCESERLENGLKSTETKHLEKGQQGQHVKQKAGKTALIRSSSIMMGWYDFSPPYSFLNGCCVASIGAAWGGSGSMWIPKELMQPSHTSDITHRAFQLYPGNLSKGTGWNMHQTWRHIRSSYHSVTSLDFGKTFRSKQLRKTPSPFIEIKKLSMNKQTTILWYPISKSPRVVGNRSPTLKKISQMQSKFPDVSEDG